MPTWLNEGLAVVFEPDGIEQSERVLASTPDRASLTDLHNGFGRLPAARVRVAYAESAVAVRRMLDLRGAPAIVALLGDLAGGVEFAAAFQQRMAMTYGNAYVGLGIAHAALGRLPPRSAVPESTRQLPRCHHGCSLTRS